MVEQRGLRNHPFCVRSESSFIESDLTEAQNTDLQIELVYSNSDRPVIVTIQVTLIQKIAKVATGLVTSPEILRGMICKIVSKNHKLWRLGRPYDRDVFPEHSFPASQVHPKLKKVPMRLKPMSDIVFC